MLHVVQLGDAIGGLMYGNYIIDIYFVVNPYLKDVIHIERTRFYESAEMFEYLHEIQQIYLSKAKHEDFIITTCIGDESAKAALNLALAKLAIHPKKEEIN